MTAATVHPSELTSGTRELPPNLPLLESKNFVSSNASIDANGSTAILQNFLGRSMETLSVGSFESMAF